MLGIVVYIYKCIYSFYCAWWVANGRGAENGVGMVSRMVGRQALKEGFSAV